MMRARTEQKVKRWHQRRLLDTVIQSVGMEWDQPRIGYTMYPAGPMRSRTSVPLACG
jgi:hypothetical protein